MAGENAFTPTGSPTPRATVMQCSTAATTSGYSCWPSRPIDAARSLGPTKIASTPLATIASTYEEPEKVVELYTRDPQLMQGLQSRVMEDQVVEWVAEHAKLTEQPLTFNEVMRPGT